ncbi:helix-turn-helix domain-containing protein [Bradyrhizobium rifense]|nr:helix-turn-helix domain-containing protein [Bradyrhizobium rifense]
MSKSKAGALRDQEGRHTLAMLRSKPEPIHYRIRRAIMADPSLTSTAKLVADALLITFRNSTTGRCNPSLAKIALAIGRSRRTVIKAIGELKAGADPWLIVRGTRGGSKDNTNNYEFRMKGTGAVCCTGEEGHASEEKADRGEAECTEGVKPTAHKLSDELSRTIDADNVEEDGPDRSLPRTLMGALRDPEPQRERPEVLQNRIAMRLTGGWNIFGDLPETERDRLTELERTGALTDEALGLAIAAARMGKA